MDSNDTAAVQATADAGGVVNMTTFRTDINVSGKINNADIAQTRTRRAQAEL